MVADEGAVLAEDAQRPLHRHRLQPAEAAAHRIVEDVDEEHRRDDHRDHREHERSLGVPALAAVGEEQDEAEDDGGDEEQRHPQGPWDDTRRAVGPVGARLLPIGHAIQVLVVGGLLDDGPRVHALEGAEDRAAPDIEALELLPRLHPRPLLVDDRAGVADELPAELAAHGDRHELRRLVLLDDEARLRLGAGARLVVAREGEEDDEPEQHGESGCDDPEDARRPVPVLEHAAGGRSAPHEQQRPGRKPRDEDDDQRGPDEAHRCTNASGIERSSRRPVGMMRDARAHGSLVSVQAVLFFGLSSFLLALMLFAVVFGATLVGIAIGRSQRHRSEQLREPFAALQAALLGVVGLLLAFGLAMAVGRYETRRAAVVDDANAIGTTYLRAQTLPEPVRSRSLARLVAYTDVSLRLSRAVPGSPAARRAGLAAERLQRELWALGGRALEAAPRDSAPRLYVETLNEMIDMQTVRVAALNNRVPPAVLVLEIAGAAIALGLLGVYLAVVGQGVLTVILAAALVTLLLLVTFDLDRPTRGIIRGPSAPLTALRVSMELPPAATAPRPAHR